MNDDELDKLFELIDRLDAVPVPAKHAVVTWPQAKDLGITKEQFDALPTVELDPK